MARIMLCDDSNTILLLLEKKLAAAGHEVVGKAKDGEDGLELYSQLNPDLTLLDVTMPNRDGRECLKDILQMNPSAKVIMISALQEGEVEQECLRNGARAFISKAKLYSGEDEFKHDVLSVIDAVLEEA